MSAHVRELLALERDDALPEVERRDLDAHLRGCAECRALRSELARNDALLRRREPAFALPPRPAARTAGALAVVARFALAAVVIVAAAGVGAAIAERRASPSPAASASATPAATVAVAGAQLHWEIFSLALPPDWNGERRTEFINMATARYLIASSKPLALPSPLPREIDWTSVPSDRIVVEVRSICSAVCAGANDESRFPLDWGQAARAADDAGFEVRSLPLTYFDTKEFVVAHIGATASARDRAALAVLVASIRPEPIPQTGYYHGVDWYAAGHADEYGIGSVSRLVIPAQAPRIEAAVFLVRGRKNFIAFPAVQGNGITNNWCELRYDWPSEELRCDRTGGRWTKYGTLIAQQNSTPGQRIDLAAHEVEVRDGTVLIHTRGIYSPPGLNDAEERPTASDCNTVTSSDEIVSVCPASGPIGTRVSVEGTCRMVGSPATLYWIFATEPYLSGKDGWDGAGIGAVPVDQNGRFRFTYVVPSGLQQIQQSGGGPTTPGSYLFMTKPAVCRVPFTVTR